LFVKEMNRSHSALSRALVHVLLGLILAVLLVTVGKALTVISLAAAVVVILIVEFVRFMQPSFNDWITGHLSLFMRSAESYQLTGASYYLVGAGITAAAFSPQIAALAVLFLAFGDPAAAMMRNRWGKLVVTSKSFTGSLPCLAICLVIALVYAWLQDMSILTAVAGAVIATVFETVPLKLNDNLTIPMGSAAAMALVAFLIS
jgi:acyl phosphate:glycerol-3-phosphate acyltransferase